MSVKCPNKSSKEYQDLVKELGSDALAHAKWNESEIKTIPFSTQRLYIDRRIKRLTTELKSLDEKSNKYLPKLEELEYLKSQIEKSKLEGKSKEVLLELGNYTLDKVEGFIKDLEEGKAIDSAKNIQHSLETLSTWAEFNGLRDRTASLFDRIIPFNNQNMVDEVQKYSTTKTPPTLEDINAQNNDIRTFKRWTGSLSDLPNYIGSTIGSIIRKTQNKVETKTKELAKDIQEQVTKLDAYAKKNGATIEDMYNTLTQEHKGTLILAKEYFENGKENKNWTKIQNTPELKEFYDFYQKIIENAEDGLPIKLGKYFIPNIRKSDLKSKIKGLNPIKSRTIKSTIEEENLLDIIPLEYHKPISASEKSNDLGTSLFQFAKFAENYREMSAILPRVRTLQEQLKYKMVDGEIQERLFINPSKPSTPIRGEDSNLYKIVDDIIEMQVKGKMKSDQGNYIIEDFFDENGNKVEKFVDFTGLADSMLRYNSLLRIGFSPIGATVNWLFGDISNTVEAVGGRYFNISNLVNASNIFIKQNFDKDSVMNQLLIKMNFLQEMDDYELAESIAKTGKANKMSTEKALEYMYSLQKAGEKFLQARTGMAVMIKDGYLTPNGELTEKYTKASEEELEQLIDKIQRLNQKIHGRYTQKEAAAAQQNVVYRLVSQFRKFIPAMVENRIGVAQYDNRLKSDVEGMYLTFGRLVLKNWKDPQQAFENLLLPLFGYKKLLEEGKMTETEIYNMRRMVAEIITASAMILFYAALHGGDDEEDKKFRRLPAVKIALTLLDRASGDLTFFYSPTEINNLAKNAIPLSKTLGDVIQATTVIPKVLYTGDYTIKKGSHKKQNRIIKELSDVTPLLKPIFDMKRIASEYSLEELN